MMLLEKIGSGGIRRVVLAGALLAGLLAFLGAGTASAHPRVFVGVGVGGPVFVPGYYAPPPPYYYYGPGPYYGPVYVGPRYGYYYHGPRYRHWEGRYHGRRYR